MGAAFSSNAFPVDGRTVVITGGSKGMGLHVGRQLAEKGANVLIVARDISALKQGIQFISEGAKNTETQRFHHISADVSKSEECSRVIAEATAWNNGRAPDVIWCAAGATHPTFLVDTPPDMFRKLMDINYFSCVYIAQAILKAWLPGHDGNDKSSTKSQSPSPSPPSSSSVPPARHIVFTSSFLALYAVAGYAPYNPSKAAIRSLSDSISQEVNLYAGAYPHEPRIRVHTIFPASIATQSFNEENLIKSDVTKVLEESDTPLSPEIVARNAISSLERGEELIATNFMTRLVMTSVLGGSTRGGFFVGACNTILAGVMALVMLFVRMDMDSQVRKFGRKHGPSGMKKAV